MSAVELKGDPIEDKPLASNRDMRRAVDAAIFRNRDPGYVMAVVCGEVVKDSRGLNVPFTAQQLSEALEKADRYDDLVEALGGAGSDFVRYLEKR